MGIEAAIIGSAIVGGVMGNKSAKTQASATKEAANISAQSASESTALQKQMYDQTRLDQTPWRDAGTRALGFMSNGIGSNGSNGELTRSFGASDFEQDPGYQFRFNQGQRAIDASAAARGGLQSGAALKAAARYGQDYSSGEYQNAYNRFQSNQTTKFNRLASIAGLGQTANNALGAAGGNYANNVTGINTGNANNQGYALLSAAAARGSAYQGWGNAFTSAATNPLLWNKSGSSANTYGPVVGATGNAGSGYDDFGWG